MCVCAFLSTDPEISPQDLFKPSIDEMYENPGASEPVPYVSLTIFVVSSRFDCWTSLCLYMWLSAYLHLLAPL